jgi:hypothetical protein
MRFSALPVLTDQNVRCALVVEPSHMPHPKAKPLKPMKPILESAKRRANSLAVALQILQRAANQTVHIVIGLVERGGKARMFHLNDATAATVRDVLVRNVSRDTTLYTDESRLYTVTGTEFAAHGTVKHSAKEYARHEGDVVVHSNTIEGVFSVFKRGMIGVYHHCGEAHLHRYLAEFDFRYNRRTVMKVTDAERTNQLLAMIEGKRLTYRRIGEGSYA